MKKLNLVLMTIFLIGSLSVSAQEQQQKSSKKNKKVETMTCWASLDCEACQAKVEKNIAFEKGVKDLDVNLQTKLIKISYSPGKTNPEKLEKAIQDLGFKTEIVKEEGAQKEEKKK